jgi:hypothetical protein
MPIFFLKKKPLTKVIRLETPNLKKLWSPILNQSNIEGINWFS